MQGLLVSHPPNGGDGGGTNYGNYTILQISKADEAMKTTMSISETKAESAGNTQQAMAVTVGRQGDL